MWVHFHIERILKIGLKPAKSDRRSVWAFRWPVKIGVMTQKFDSGRMFICSFPLVHFHIERIFQFGSIPVENERRNSLGISVAVEHSRTFFENVFLQVFIGFFIHFCNNSINFCRLLSKLLKEHNKNERKYRQNLKKSTWPKSNF